MDKDTIAAIATPPGSGGIGIVRVSGPGAFTVARALFTKNKTPSANRRSSQAQVFEHRRMYLGQLIDPRDGKVLDQVILAAMHAPHSYTREHVVEFQCHGGELVLRGVLSAVLAQGARLADPGEFTRRAFLNGRIDLSQAEAVIDLINASNEAALASALRHLDGALKTQVNDLVGRLTEQLTLIEACIEFSEEIGRGPERDNVSAALRNSVREPLHTLVQDSEQGQAFVHGFLMDIVGRPNVGKSSLLNRLLGKERAIVTEVPGTTRDLIEDTTRIQGIPLRITDTAGIHASNDPVESIGIQKARQRIGASDLVLFVIEACDTQNPKDAHVLDAIGARPVILVINKIDLDEKQVVQTLPARFQELTAVRVSARTEEGLDDLRQVIVEHFSKRKFDDNTDPIIANLRQIGLLKQAGRAVDRALDALDSGLGEDLVAEDLNEAILQLRRVIGEALEMDILDRVFERFCIGK